MQALDLAALAAPGATVLCIGAHCDDLEIGCGGTVLRLIEAQPALEFVWVVLCSTELRKREAEEGARRFLAGAKRAQVEIGSFRDGFLPYHGEAVKERLEAVKRAVCPALILTHFRGDLHQDHRSVGELTWQTFRDHLVLEYEIPKFDGDLGAPNVFVPLGREHAQRKVEHVLAAFPSQGDRRWWSEETFRALMRLRGIECNAEHGYAEAFYGRKVVLGLGSR